MATQNSANLKVTNNADGYDVAGGTTARKLTISGADIAIAGSGANVFTFPSATSTLATIALAETLTSKTLTSPIVSGAGGTTAGQYGYDTTDKFIKIGDGTANQSIFTSAWKSFTPSYTNWTVGNGTNVGAYAQVGKVVFFRASFTFGSSSSISGTPVLTFPVTISSSYSAFPPIAQIRMALGGVVYMGFMGTGGSINGLDASVTYLKSAPISATIPATWTTNDTWAIQGFYEAA